MIYIATKNGRYGVKCFCLSIEESQWPGTGPVIHGMRSLDRLRMIRLEKIRVRDMRDREIEEYIE